MNHSEVDSIIEHHPLLRCEPKYGAIVCLECNNDFPSKRIALYLSKTHRISKKLYGPILQSLRQETLAQDWENLHHPSHGSTPIEGLKVRMGYTCMRCDHRTTSDGVARGHLKCKQLHRVHLQCWNPSAARKYWTVTPLLMPTHAAAAVDDSFTSGADTSIPELAFWRHRTIIATSRHRKAVAARVSIRGRRRVSSHRGKYQWWHQYLAWVYAMAWDISWKRSCGKKSMKSSCGCWRLSLVDRIDSSFSSQECQSSGSHENQRSQASSGEWCHE